MVAVLPHHIVASWCDGLSRLLDVESWRCWSSAFGLSVSRIDVAELSILGGPTQNIGGYGSLSNNFRGTWHSKKPQGQPNLRVVRALKTFKAIEPLKSLKPSTSEEFETRCRTVRLEMGFEGLKLEIKG